MWYREGHKNGKWAIRKVIEIPAEPADPEKLPPLLKGFKAVPPLVSDINLSLDEDRKSTRLNSSHLGISYAVFCLKKKKHVKMTDLYHYGRDDGRGLVDARN